MEERQIIRAIDCFIVKDHAEPSYVDISKCENLLGQLVDRYRYHFSHVWFSIHDNKLCFGKDDIQVVYQFYIPDIERFILEPLFSNESKECNECYIAITCNGAVLGTYLKF